MTDNPNAFRQSWTCDGILGPRTDSANASFALIILNQPITRPDILRRLWQNAQVKICADGGGNRLHDTLRAFRGGNLDGPRGTPNAKDVVSDLRETFLPDVIKGDLDSLRPDVRDYYASKGVEIIKDGSEYSTDLQKCIQYVEEMEQTTGSQGEALWIPIVIYGGLSGRLDQTTAVLSLLHKLRRKSKIQPSSKSSSATHDKQVSWPKSEQTSESATETKDHPLHDRSNPGTVKLPTGEEMYISYADDADALETSRRTARGVGRRDIRVVNDDCIAWVLDSGTHEIDIDHSTFGETCGVLPLGVEESRVTTTGLKWDFDWLTSFNTQISTSNHLLPENPQVVVTTSRPVYWTMEIR